MFESSLFISSFTLEHEAMLAVILSKMLIGKNPSYVTSFETYGRAEQHAPNFQSG